MVVLTDQIVYIRTKSTPEAVKKLNLWGCDVEDIELCKRMVNLEILSLSVNQVHSLEPLKACTKIKELYLRRNRIDSLSELEHLKDMKELRVLWVDENPCTEKGEYRHKVVAMLPQITTLDDKPVTLDDQRESPRDPPEDPNASRRPNPMTQSIYGRTIVDTVMPAGFVQYGTSSEDEERDVVTPTFTPRHQVTLRGAGGSSAMTQSFYAGLDTEEQDDEWGDFLVDEEASPRPLSMDSISSRMMAQSLYESRDPPEVSPRRPGTSLTHHHPLHHPVHPHAYQTMPHSARSMSMPRRRFVRTQSTSPAREVRTGRLISAVSALLDELDQDGLRQVIEEAQRRIKKNF